MSDSVGFGIWLVVMGMILVLMSPLYFKFPKFMVGKNIWYDVRIGMEAEYIRLCFVSDIIQGILMTITGGIVLLGANPVVMFCVLLGISCINGLVHRKKRKKYFRGE